MKEIVIDPITRLEGHGKITIFLNDEGNVENAYFQVPELRGFEKFCEGRRAEDLPIITTRICGVCPVAHHMAGAKALDAAFNVEPTETAKKLRELEYCGYFIYDHILHFYFLGGPDFVVGPDAPAAKRNILGVIEKAGLEVAGEVIKHRAFGQRITGIIGGRPTHPVSAAMPGGIAKAIDEDERQEIEDMLKSCHEFAKFSLKLFDDIVLKNADYVNLITSDPYNLPTYYMGTVDKNNKVNFYDGKVRVVDPEGKEFVKFGPSEYLDVIEERVEPWTYVKMPYLKKVGWNGFTTGPKSGIYRVGPLGRLNASEGMATPVAQAEYERMCKTLGKPVHATLAFHWARLIELMYATERGLELIKDPEITSKNIRNKPGKPGEGVGIVEAARGTLIHHYQLDENALAKKINLVVATTHNAPGICMSVKNAAQGIIKDGEVNDGLLNKVEMAFRAYDPCWACATHFAIGEMPLEVNVFDSDKKLVKKVVR
ncbi:MAG: Ni/Fe hydrogenase subunit alpha [Candidatus Bathyarchaeota archaeon]|jgi:F420-non-reducing hydrogenase large subunit|nr:Ni/Fe hydrogenase subunit alpha [Candidatus Bathyarchaeota archaeon]